MLNRTDVFSWLCPTRKHPIGCYLSLLLLSSGLMIGGCRQPNQDTTQQTDEIKALKAKVKTLEAENKTLKEQQANLGLGSDPLKSAQPVTETAANADVTASPAVAFNDIADVPTQSLIADLIKLGIFDATPDQNFQPYQTISRGEYITWLFKAHNAISRPDNKIRLAPTYQPEFTDISSQHPAYAYVQALANAGYSVGYEDKTFKPDQPITREEMISIKVGVDKGKSIKPLSTGNPSVWKFSDGAEIDRRYSGYIHQDYFSGGPQGSNIQRAFGKVGTFKPKQAVLRHEAAATLWQMGFENAEKALKRQEKELS